MPDSVITEDSPKASSEEQKEVKEQKEEPKEEPKEEVSEEELSEAQEALKIYNLLKDPKQGPEVVRFLARQAGLEIKEGTSVKTATKVAADVLKESLGTEYEFLAPKLLPGLRALINEEVAEVKRAMMEGERAKLSQDYDNAWESLNEQTEGDFEKHGESIIKAMEEFPYTGKQPIKQYLGKLYKMVGGEKVVEKKVSKTIERIKRNAEEQEVQNSGAGDDRVKNSSRLPTREEAIAAAMKGKTL